MTTAILGVLLVMGVWGIGYGASHSGAWANWSVIAGAACLAAYNGLIWTALDEYNPDRRFKG
jgi:hypothetical protein